MANDILINAISIGSYRIKPIADDLNNAKKQLDKLNQYGALASATYCGPDGRTALFPMDYADRAADAGIKLAVILNQLEQYRKLLDAAPEEFSDIDNRYKNQLIDWWGHTTYLAEAFFDGLFSPGSSTTVKEKNAEDVFGQNTAKDILTLNKWLEGEWVDDHLAELPMWAREFIKEHLPNIFENLPDEFDQAKFITEVMLMIASGDKIGALKKIAEELVVKDGPPIISTFTNLDDQFYINAIFGMLEEYQEYVKDPSLVNLLNIGWSSTGGALFKTAGDAAWDIVKILPGSGWYDKYGVKDAKDAFNVIYTEMKIEVDKACKEDGGFFKMWLNGWNSIL